MKILIADGKNHEDELYAGRGSTIAIANADVVIVRGEDGSYSIYKDRHLNVELEELR